MFKTYKKQILLALVLVIPLVAIIFGAYYASRKQEQAKKSDASGVVSLYFEPVEVTSALNTVLTPKIKVNPFTESVTGIALNLTFDPTKISIENITNASSFPLLLQSPVINNNAGTASVVIGVGCGTCSITSLVDAFNLSIKTKGVYGNAVITVASTSYVTAKGKDVSVLGTFGQMTVHIPNPATASPTITPTKSPSPTPTTAGTASPTASPTKSPSPTSTSSSTTYPNWDVDQNGLINVVDIGMVTDQYDVVNPSNIRVDVDRNGVVNVIDIGIIIDHYQ